MRTIKLFALKYEMLENSLEKYSKDFVGTLELKTSTVDLNLVKMLFAIKDSDWTAFDELL